MEKLNGSMVAGLTKAVDELNDYKRKYNLAQMRIDELESQIYGSDEEEP